MPSSAVSKRYLEHIRPVLKVPGLYLPQAATGTSLSRLPTAVEKDIDILFVGSNYYSRQKPAHY
jgi:hypothetical protein